MAGNQGTFLGIDRHAEAATQLFKALTGAAVVAVVIRLLLEGASRLHWALGAILATAFAVVAVWLTYQVRHASRDADRTGVLSVLAVGLLTVAMVCAWVSFTLHAGGLGVYTVPSRYSAGTFVDLYMYTFLDLLPGIEALKTLNVKPPIVAQDAISGLPVLAFKVFTVWLFFDAFLSYRKPREAAAG